MAILTHGRDMTLAPTIAPVVRQTDQTVRGALTALSQCGFDAVQLDALLAGVRPRELDQRARKDLLGLLSRSTMRLAGIDMFIPRAHFVDTDRVDRAMEAALAGIQLAADLGRVPLSIALPVEQLDDDVQNELVTAADGCGVRLAVHLEDQLDALAAWADAVDLPILGGAIDPAAVLARSGDPVETVQRLGRRLTVARLDDFSMADALRCPAGRGDLDVTAYRIALDLAESRTGPVVLDLRGLDQAIHAAAQSKHAWDRAAFTVE